MSKIDNSLYEDLVSRGLIAQSTNEKLIQEHLSADAVTLYSGFDPTADSLHIGSLVPLLTLKRFQQSGHRPIVLVGGATGLIGDPSFKSEERKLNTPETVSSWVDKLKKQTSAFLSFGSQDNSAVAVNNLDWTKDVSVLDFLRDIGKHFSINNMIQKESVKQRIDREGEGISFTEFSYMLLQSFDFAELNSRYGCTLQIGGSDQWGNITGGIDLTRRKNGKQVFGLTLPLVTKSDGTKFGKTESGTIWLDPARTSPYAFYQFWLGTADDDVYKFLKYFTFLNVEEIDRIEAEDSSRQGRPEAQKILAQEVTRLVHGEEGLLSAERITQSLFSGDSASLNLSDILQLKQDGLPHAKLDLANLSDTTITKMLADTNIANGKQVKDAVLRGAVSINGVTVPANPSELVMSVLTDINPIADNYYLTKIGKKKHILVET